MSGKMENLEMPDDLTGRELTGSLENPRKKNFRGKSCLGKLFGTEFALVA